MELQRNIYLKNYTTFKIGGPARYFCIARNEKDLIGAVSFAKKEKLPFFILGGGSNLLVSDNGYSGLVLKIQNSKVKTQNYKSKLKIICGAGLSLASLIARTSELGAAGMEWAAGIPGATVGGAIRGNAGAFETEMKDLVKSVEAIDFKTGKIKIFDNKACGFAYRGSIFKRNSDLIILSAEMEFKKRDKNEIKNKIKEILNYRMAKHPKFPSAGSIFKNLESMRARDLIEKAGLNGKRIGRAQISEQHANFIINTGGAKAKDVLELIDLAKKEVKNKLGVKIEEEIKLLGDF